MKEKLKLVFLITLLMLTITGCKSNNMNISEDNPDTVRIENVFFVFDQDLEFNDFKFKGVKHLNIEESQQAAYFEYHNEDIYNGRFVFRVGLSFTNETTLQNFLGENQSEKVTINGITWDKVTLNNKIDEKDTTATVYATQKNSTVYAVSIIKFSEAEKVDLGKLTEVFMNGVTIK